MRKSRFGPAINQQCCRSCGGGGGGKAPYDYSFLDGQAKEDPQNKARYYRGGPGPGPDPAFILQEGQRSSSSSGYNGKGGLCSRPWAHQTVARPATFLQQQQ